MNEVNIPVIPREVAEAIEYLRKDCRVYDAVILRNALSGQYGTTACPKRRAVGDFANNKTTVLAAALVNGWTVEKTPEEAVFLYYRNIYEKLTYTDVDVAERNAGISAVISTLNLLGIEIEGVNA